MRSKNGEKRLLMTVSIRPYVLSNLNDASNNSSQGFCKRCSFQCFSERNMTNSLNFKLRNCGTGNVVVDSLNQYMDIKRLKKRLIFDKKIIQVNYRYVLEIYCIKGMCRKVGGGVYGELGSLPRELNLHGHIGRRGGDTDRGQNVQ